MEEKENNLPPNPDTPNSDSYMAIVYALHHPSIVWGAAASSRASASV